MSNRQCPSCNSELRTTYQADGWRCAACKHLLAYDSELDQVVLARAIAQADADPGDCHA